MNVGLTSMKYENIKAYLLLIATMIFWGGSWPVAKIAVKLAPTFTVGFFRFLIASTLFSIPLFLYHKPRKYNRTTLRDFSFLGSTGIFGYGFFFLIGLKYTTAAQGSIIAGINPVSISIFAHILYKERLNRKWQYIGFILSFIGVIFVIGVQSLIELKPDYIIGNLLILAAMGCWGIYTNIGKKVMDNYSPLETTAGGAILGMMLFGIGAVSEEFWNEPCLVNVEFWILILFLGIFATFLGFFFYFEGIRTIGPTHASVFINLVPIFGTLFSAIFLRETIYWTFIIGLFFIIFGIMIINSPFTRDADHS